MLFSIPGCPGAEVFTHPFGMVANGVEFVVSENHEGGSFLYHPPDNMKGFADLGAAINDIANKNRLTGTVVICAAFFPVAHLFEKFFQDGGVTMNVTDDVVGGHLEFI